MSMTAAELIEQLKTVPGDRKVVLSKDEEGNGFRHANASLNDFFDFDEMEAYHPDDAEEQGLTDRAVVIW